MDFSYMHFYKHMGGFFMHSISLPEKLTKQLVHLVGKLLELERPSGSTWYVGLIRSGDKLVLQPGWNDFASANNVSQNDHLVFKFIGESKFQVFIFDPTGCEKGGSFEKEEQERDENLGLAVGEELSKEVHKFDIKEKDKQHEIQGEIESSILNKKKPPTEEEQGGSEASNDSIPIEELRKILYQKGERQKVQGETKLQQPNIATKPPSKKLERNEEENKETSKDSVPIGKLFRTKTQKSKHYCEILGETETPTMKRRRPNQYGTYCAQYGTKKYDRNGDGTSRHASKKANHALSGKPYHVYNKLAMSVMQQKIADEMASATQPGSKLFLKILSSSDLHVRLVIPSTFARQNIGKRSQQISLLAANKEKVFPANYKYNEKLQWIGRGWREFVLGNNLEEKNHCLFELKRLDGTELAIVVHVQPRAN